MLFAESGTLSGSTCLAVFLVLAVIGLVMKNKEAERKAEAQRRMAYYHPAPPSLTGQIARGVGTSLFVALIRSMLGLGHHGHHHRHHG
jgi:hypothetical protein